MADFVTDAQIHANSLARCPFPARAKTGLARLVFWGIISLLSSTVCPAQTKKSVDLFEQGMRLFVERKATEAIPFFQQALIQSPTYLDAQLRLGQAYEFTNRPQQALATYQATLATQPNPAQAAIAYQGASQLLMRRGRYAEAIPLLERFATTFAPESAKGRQVARLLATARYGQQAVANPVAVVPQPVAPALNVGESQYFPVLTADEQTMVFTMVKPEGDEDLMTATWLPNGGWQPPVTLSTNINSPDNEGTATLSADGRLLVFTACQTGARQGFGGCDLFSSQKTGTVWSQPVNMGAAINTRNFESQPSLSADGRQLYFVSDRPGGVGQRDIWRSTLDATGNWGEPTNLGKPVNTPFEEASPFLHANGQVLFFASQGHLGLGGYDLFLSRLQPDSSRTPAWNTPTNLGYPINNADNQAALFVTANGTKAYYSFEEQKDGVSQKSRIYSFELPAALREQVRPVNYLKGTVTNIRTGKPLPATLDLMDLSTNKTVSKVAADPQTGQYVAVLPAGGDYALYVSAPGHLFKSLSFNYTDKTSAETGMGRGLLLDAALEPLETTSRETLNNLFFESGRYELTAKSVTEIQRLAQFLTLNPTTRIEIAGHTDDRGVPAANLELSRKRAQTVVDYLVRQGITPARLVAVGFGKTRPAVKGTTDEARQQNRRIEWRVL